MIKTTFSLGSDMIETIIDGNTIKFFDVSTGMITTIEGIRLDKSGSLKEFPDLKDNEDWKKITLDRFKTKFKSFKTENEANNYVIDELTKQGYKAIMKQRAGWRPTRIK